MIHDAELRVQFFEIFPKKVYSWKSFEKGLKSKKKDGLVWDRTPGFPAMRAQRPSR
jgi:hypothetical protein